MSLNKDFGRFAVAAIVVCAPVMAAPTAIGNASAAGGIVVDSARASSNATVFDGSTLQSAGNARIRLSNGTRLNLTAGSNAQVFAGRLTLNTGSGEVRSSSKFEIDARSLRIQPVGSDSVANVKIESGDEVLVTASNAPVDVRNSGGVLVARVYPSLPMNFLPQAAAPSSTAGATFNSTGCLLDAGDSVIVSDSTGNQVYDLRGKKGVNFKSNIGKNVTVAGVIDPTATPKPGAVKAAKGATVQVVSVGGIKAASGGSDCGTLAKTLGVSAVAAAGVGVAAGAASAGTVAAAASAAGVAGVATAGISTTAIVVTGVAVGAAATAGGVAAATSGGSCVSPCSAQ
jgi:hypothetical protein